MIWMAADHRWKILRTLCSTQLFTRHSLDAAQGLRLRKVQDLVGHLRGRAGRMPVDVGRAAFTTTINLISNTLFSADLADIGSDSAQEFRDLVWGVMEEVGKPNVSDFFPLLRALDVQGTRRRVAAHLDKLMLVFDDMIHGRLRAVAQGSSTPFDFLDALLRLQDRKDGDFKLDRRSIRALLMDIFLAGSHTSSNTVEWAMAELLANPDAMAKAREELVEVIGGSDREVEESDIPRLPYLQAVVKEVLRLHPPGPLLLQHEAVSGVELGGYAVRKGTGVLVNAWAISRGEETWELPDSFMPERFMGNHAVDFRGRDWELIPFGAGRRMCPGIPLALRMVQLMLASLLHSFEWRLPNGMGASDVDLTEKFGVTSALATPLHAVATPY